MPPRQYLIISDMASEDAIPDAVQEKIDAYDVASILLEGADRESLSRKTTSLLPLCHKHNIALLIEDQFELVKELGLDGVHIKEDETLIKKARQTLGEGFIIGGDAGLSRHKAMLMGEMEADYIAFSGGTNKEILDMCTWWTPLFQIPCVALLPAGDEKINTNSDIDFYSYTIRG